MAANSPGSAAQARRTATRAGSTGAVDGSRPRREEELTAIAVRHFFRLGYSGTSMQSIADDFGVLKGSLYHYIKSKEDLLFRVLVDVHENLESILDEVAELPDMSPRELLREYVRRQIGYTSRHMQEMAIYYNESQHLAKPRRKQLDMSRERHRAFVDGLIREMQQSGEAPSELPPGVLANIALGSTIWLYTWYKPGGAVPPERIADACADFVISGLSSVGTDLT
jgi:AcrR family transcriptional regulator